MTQAAVLTTPDRRPASGRIWLTVAALALLGLLTAPLPIVWIGLAALVVVLLGRGRAIARAGAGLPFWLSMVPYIAGALVGYSVTIRPDAAEIRLFGILAGLAAFALVALAADTPQSARRLARSMLIVTVIATPIVFLIVAPFLPLERLPSNLYGWTSVFEPIRRVVLDQDDVLQRYRLRASGLGTLAAFGIGLALGPLIAGRDLKSRAVAGLGILYFGLFLLAAGNRGAMLSAGLVTMLLVVGRHRWLLGGGLAVALSALVVVSGLARIGAGGPADRVLGLLSGPTTDPGSVQRRMEFWDNSLFLLSDFRFTGVGLGIRSVQEIYETYFIPIEPRFSHSHNIFLQTYLEQGLLGLVGFIGLVALGLVVGWQALVRVRQPDARSAVVSATGAGLALLVAGLTEIVALTAVGMVMLFSALALILVVGQFARSETPVAVAAPRSNATKRIAIGATILSLIGAVGAWPLATTAQSEPPTADGLISQPSFVDRLTAVFELNRGAVEVTKVSVGVDRPRAERDERLTNAEEFLRVALDHDPMNLGAYRNLAAVHAVQSQRSAARRVLNQAEALTAPDDDRTTFQIGRLYRDNGDVDRAIDAWTRAGAAPQLVAWGATAVRRNQWRAAIDVNRAAIRVAPSERSPWHGVARGVDEISGQRAAIITMERLANLYPGVPWPYLEAGDLLRESGDSAQAQEWYRRAAAISPSEPAIQERLTIGEQPGLVGQ